MERITQKRLDLVLKRYAKEVGGHIAESYDDVGGYRFDKAYGQNRIVRIVSEGGGESDISPRLSTGEMERWMFAGINTLDEYKRNSGLLPY